MSRRSSGSDNRDQVGSLVSELDELTRELGMPRPVPTKAGPPATEAEPQAADAANHPAGSAPSHPWWDGEPEEVIDLPPISLPPLPGATESEPEIEMRPWSPAIASLPIPQSVVPVSKTPASAAAAPSLAPGDERRSRTMTVVAVVGVIVAGAVYLLTTHVDLVSTSGPSTPTQAAPVTLTGLRATAAASVTDAESAGTREHFPPTTTQVVVDAVLNGTSPGDELEYRVEYAPPGAPLKLISDKVQPASPSASHHIAYVVTSSSLAPGNYTVTVFHGDRELGSTSFTIDASPTPPVTASPPSPTPRR